MDTRQIPSTNPTDHINNIERLIHQVKEHCLNDLEILDHQDDRALLETTVEVLGGLESAFEKHARHSSSLHASEGEIVSPKSNEPWD